MWGILLSGIVTSAVDSLNPFAISQQAVLQGIVKKPQHIWYYIIANGATNFIGGLIIYFGLAAFLRTFLNTFIDEYGPLLFIVELILGLVCMLVAVYLMHNNMKTKSRSENSNTDHSINIQSVSPMALVTLGVIGTISELPTAFPYVAFITVLINYQPTIIQVIFILLLYNFIFVLPLIILYFIYMKAREQFDHIYQIITIRISKWTDILVPLLIGIIGFILIYHSISILNSA